jgi:hypothetical protein
MIDAQAIIFLRLCRESTGILLRFSIELSKYEAEIEHVPGEDNIISDVLSRQHVDIDKIMEEEKVLKPMNRRNQRVWSFRNNQIKKTHQISERMIKNEYGIIVIKKLNNENRTRTKHPIITLLSSNRKI